MNDKSLFLHQLVDIVVDCCAIQIDEEGTMSVTRERVLSKDRSENCVMTRCILVSIIAFAGYSIETTALLLKRTPQAVRHLLDLSQEYHKSSRAYKIAEAEALLKVKPLL